MPRFEIWHRNKWISADATTIQEMVEMIRKTADCLQEMADAGVVLDPEGSTSDDYALLITEDPEIAARFDMEPEDNWGDELDDDDDEDDPEDLDNPIVEEMPLLLI